MAQSYRRHQHNTRQGKGQDKMVYEVIDKDLKIEACENGNLPPEYKAFKDFTLSYLQSENSEREKLDLSEDIKEDAAVIDRIIEQRRIEKVLDILGYSYISEAPREIIQSIFREYNLGSIGLCQVFNYGVIEGKRAERAKRKAKQCIEQEK